MVAKILVILDLCTPVSGSTVFQALCEDWPEIPSALARKSSEAALV